MNVGDVIVCVVTEVGQWGAYLKTNGGQRGFVDGMEFGWLSASTEAVKVGEDIQVKIMKFILREDPFGKTYSFVASIREVNPERNPWYNPSIYAVGKIFQAKVRTSQEDFLVLELKTGALALVLIGGWNGTPPTEGQETWAEIISVDFLHKKIQAQLVEVPGLRCHPLRREDS